MNEKYMAELAPVPRLIIDELPPKGTKVWLISRYGFGYAREYRKDYKGIIAWCPLPKLTDEQKNRLKSIGVM